MPLKLATAAIFILISVLTITIGCNRASTPTETPQHTADNPSPIEAATIKEPDKPPVRESNQPAIGEDLQLKPTISLDNSDVGPAAKFVETAKVTDPFPNGRPHRRSTFKVLSNGRRMLDGTYQQWYKDGQIQEEGNYINDRRDGTWSQWYPNGQLRRKQQWVAGRLEGQWLEFREDGTLQQTVSYHAGERHGVWRTFAADVKPPKNEHDPLPAASGEETYVADQREGVARTWYPNGQLKSEVHYLHGKLQGNATEWHANGKMASVTPFDADEISGPVQRWDENGKVVDDQ